MKTRKGHAPPEAEVRRCLGTAMCVLKTEPGSSLKTGNPLNSELWLQLQGMVLLFLVSSGLFSRSTIEFYHKPFPHLLKWSCGFCP